MNKTCQILPIPEISDANLNHSFKVSYFALFELNSISIPNFMFIFKFNQPDNRKNKKPPKLHPKEHSYRQVHHDVHVVSFSDLSNTPLILTPERTNSFNASCYDRYKSNSYYEQCFDQLCKIGEGSFGEVFQVRSREDGKLYAVKKTKQFSRSENHRKERLEEVRRYRQFSNNEHCIKFYKAWEQDDLLYIQIELCRGSVEDYVAETKRVSENFVWSFLIDMLAALKSFHERNLVHLDVKLDNILITDDNSCKLCDFGLVFDLTNSARSKAIEGDSRYLPPELLQGNYCLANDVFSLGVTLLELSSNLELPSNGQLWQELRSGVIPQTALDPLSKELQTIIREMMEPNPLTRPTVSELMQKPILKRKILGRNIRNFVKKIVSKLLKCTLIIMIMFTDCINSMYNFSFKVNIPRASMRACVGFSVSFFMMIYNFFVLDNSSRKTKTYIASPQEITNRFNETNSDFCDTSFKTFPTNESNVSRSDDDNNNDDSNNTTPTMNNQIPRITPEIKIVNSTPLNHFNHQNGLSNRKFRRDLTKSR